MVENRPPRIVPCASESDTFSAVMMWCSTTARVELWKRAISVSIADLKQPMSETSSWRQIFLNADRPLKRKRCVDQNNSAKKKAFLECSNKRRRKGDSWRKFWSQPFITYPYIAQICAFSSFRLQSRNYLSSLRSSIYDFFLRFLTVSF